MMFYSAVSGRSTGRPSLDAPRPGRRPAKQGRNQYPAQNGARFWLPSLRTPSPESNALRPPSSVAADRPPPTSRVRPRSCERPWVRVVQQNVRNVPRLSGLRANCWIGECR